MSLCPGFLTQKTGKIIWILWDCDDFFLKEAPYPAWRPRWVGGAPTQNCEIQTWAEIKSQRFNGLRHPGAPELWWFNKSTEPMATIYLRHLLTCKMRIVITLHRCDTCVWCEWSTVHRARTQPPVKHKQPIFISLKHNSIRRVGDRTNWDLIKKLNFGEWVLLHWKGLIKTHHDPSRSLVKGFDDPSSHETTPVTSEANRHKLRCKNRETQKGNETQI